MIIGTWIVPYDRTSVDVVYLQGVGGHVVLVELDNKGSRSITDVQLDIRFLDDDSNEIASLPSKPMKLPHILRLLVIT